MKIQLILWMITIGSSKADCTVAGNGTTACSSPSQTSSCCPPVQCSCSCSCLACPNECPNPGTTAATTTPTTATTPGSSVCKDGYTKDESTGNCYRVIKEYKNWNASKTICEAEEAELASIKSSEEWTFVKGLLPNRDVWLGGSRGRAEEESNWVWTDGSPVTFSDWYPGRPFSSTTLNCMAVRSGRWYDNSCSLNRYPVCKIPA